jgi:pimeloyl-ACP methyl ester carboxylesterase
MKKFLRVLLLLLLPVAAAGACVYQFRPAWLIEARFAAERWRAGASEHRVTVGDHQWAYLDAGSGPPVVLVHGFSGSKENWLPTMPYLEGHRLIAVDLPGWGASTRLDGADYGVSAQAGRLADFIAALQLERPIVIGHSMGGHISGVFATRHPESLSALVLVASAGVRFRANEFAQRVLAGQTPFNVDDRAGWDRLLHELFEKPPWLPPRVVDELVARNVANHAFHDRIIDVIRRGDAAFQLERELALLKTPLSVIWCERDRILDASSVDAFRYVPGVRIVLLPDCGHMSLMEVPHELAAAIQLPGPPTR